jgi:hypothetical protein
MEYWKKVHNEKDTPRFSGDYIVRDKRDGVPDIVFFNPNTDKEYWLEFIIEYIPDRIPDYTQ